MTRYYSHSAARRQLFGSTSPHRLKSMSVPTTPVKSRNCSPRICVDAEVHVFFKDGEVSRRPFQQLQYQYHLPVSDLFESHAIYHFAHVETANEFVKDVQNVECVERSELVSVRRRLNFNDI